MTSKLGSVERWTTSVCFGNACADEGSCDSRGSAQLPSREQHRHLYKGINALATLNSPGKEVARVSAKQNHTEKLCICYATHRQAMKLRRGLASVYVCLDHNL